MIELSYGMISIWYGAVYESCRSSLLVSHTFVVDLERLFSNRVVSQYLVKLSGSGSSCYSLSYKLQSQYTQ